MFCFPMCLTFDFNLDSASFSFSAPHDSFFYLVMYEYYHANGYLCTKPLIFILSYDFLQVTAPFFVYPFFSITNKQLTIRIKSHITFYRFIIDLNFHFN